MSEISLRSAPAQSWGDRCVLALALVAAAAILATPAIWNGFPLLYPDTGGYLARPFEGDLELGRSALYGVFLAAGIPTFFWANVAAQTAAVVWLIWLTLRVTGLAAHPWLVLAIVAALSILSGIGWYAAMLLPDIWLSASIIALYLLAFRASELSRGECAGLIAVVAFAMASHMGTLGICVALVIALAAFSFVARRFIRESSRPALKFAAIAVLAGLLIAPLSNFVIAGKFKFTPGGDSFMFGRLIQDGIIARYLEDRCPNPAIRLCAYRNKMPTMADDWLWAPGNILSELGGWRAFAEEERRITLETLRMYPLMHVTEAAQTTWEQLLKTKTEVSLVPDWMSPTTETFKMLVPQMTPTMLSARQHAAPFPELIAALNLIHIPVAAFSTVALIVLLALARPLALPSEITALIATVLAAILINAFVCGTFSNPVDRYESRLIWLAPFALAVTGLTWQRRRAHRV